jgi:hypothetical protein
LITDYPFLLEMFPLVYEAWRCIKTVPKDKWINEEVLSTIQLIEKSKKYYGF